MIEGIVFGAVTGALFLMPLGLRRLPWRYAAISALGWGVAFAALRLAQLGFDAGSLVLLGAVGGSLASVGWERGERARVRRTATILEARPSTLP